MSKLGYFHRPSQMSYHDLCTNTSPPKGIGLTLGLGLKFCIQANTPQNNLNKSYDRFISDVRKRYIFAGTTQKETPKKIYTKSRWIPTTTEDHIEDRLHKFVSQIQHTKNMMNKRNKTSTNITKIQQQHLKMLKNNEKFIILMADKNLGPCIMERAEYIRCILKEHLNQKDTYKYLTQKEGEDKLQAMKIKCISILKTYVKYTSVDEKKYFINQLQLDHRISQFYGTPKVHKNKHPTPFRPVVS